MANKETIRKREQRKRQAERKAAVKQALWEKEQDLIREDGIDLFNKFQFGILEVTLCMNGVKTDLGFYDVKCCKWYRGEDFYHYRKATRDIRLLQVDLRDNYNIEMEVCDGDCDHSGDVCGSSNGFWYRGPSFDNSRQDQINRYAFNLLISDLADNPFFDDTTKEVLLSSLSFSIINK